MLKNRLEAISLIEELKDEVMVAELECDHHWEMELFWTEEISRDTFRAVRELGWRAEMLKTIEKSLWEDEASTLDLLDSLIEEIEELQEFRAADNADYLAELGETPKKYLRAEKELTLRHGILMDLKDCLLKF